MTTISPEVKTPFPELELVVVGAEQVHDLDGALGKVACLKADTDARATKAQLEARHALNEIIGSHMGPAYEALCGQDGCAVGVILREVVHPDTGEASFYDHDSHPIARPLSDCYERS